MDVRLAVWVSVRAHVQMDVWVRALLHVADLDVTVVVKEIAPLNVQVLDVALVVRLDVVTHVHGKVVEECRLLHVITVPPHVTHLVIHQITQLVMIGLIQKNKGGLSWRIKLHMYLEILITRILMVIYPLIQFPVEAIPLVHIHLARIVQLHVSQLHKIKPNHVAVRVQTPAHHVPHLVAVSVRVVTMAVVAVVGRVHAQANVHLRVLSHVERVVPLALQIAHTLAPESVRKLVKQNAQLLAWETVVAVVEEDVVEIVPRAA